jgi:hypothetical protein
VTLAESFSRRTTHLICPAGEGAKFNKAQEWRVPVVGNEWMAEMARIGVVPPARNFLVGRGGARIEPPQESSVSVSVDVEALYTRGKGKGPQRLGVADITNGWLLPSERMRPVLTRHQDLVRTVSPRTNRSSRRCPVTTLPRMTQRPRTSRSVCRTGFWA